MTTYTEFRILPEGNAAMNEQKRFFWDQRARMLAHAGTDDFVLQELEERVILAHIPIGSRVLDVGCGDGRMLEVLAVNRQCEGVGLDFSDTFIERCRSSLKGMPLVFVQGSMLDVEVLIEGDFDVILTKRSLINLDSSSEQFQVLSSLIKFLRPGGLLLVLESTIEGLSRLNQLRAILSLPEMIPPWHNVYISEKELERFGRTSEVAKYDVINFASTYYFLSRVVNAHLAKIEHREARYDDPVNLLALELPALGEFGAPRLHIFTKVGA